MKDSQFFPKTVQDCHQPPFTDGHPTIYPDNEGVFHSSMPQELRDRFSLKEFLELVVALNEWMDEARRFELEARNRVTKLQDRLCCISLLAPPLIGGLIWGLPMCFCLPTRCCPCGRDVGNGAGATEERIQSFIEEHNKRLAIQHG